MVFFTASSKSKGSIIKQIELIQCKNFWNKIQAQYIASVNSSCPKQDINGKFNLVINKFSCLLFLSSFEKLQRRLILTATSALVRARYHPSQCQILTLATDGQVSYFEVIDGTEIRNIVLGKHSTVTSLDVSPGQGENFITSTNDSLVKVIIFFYFYLIFVCNLHFSKLDNFYLNIAKILTKEFILNWNSFLDFFHHSLRCTKLNPKQIVLAI